MTGPRLVQYEPGGGWFASPRRASEKECTDLTRSAHSAEAGAKDSAKDTGEGLVPLAGPPEPPPGLCPHLGSRKDPGDPTGRPSRRNVCHVQERVKTKGIRRVIVPYSPVSQEKQAMLCLGKFTTCAAFRKHSGDTAGLAGEEESQSHSRRGRGEDRSARQRAAKRWQLATQLGAALMVCAVLAFGLFLFLASNPASFIEYLQMTIIKNEIKAFGMRHLGVKGKFGKSAGLVTGGQMRSMKTMSEATNQKLMRSGAFKGLSK